ncbi:MAG: diaminopimelate epimerase [Elusimicrobiales bacterium]|nr:diaminopimelate epimerase [Elusimicrobiales bacterium]
MQIDFWKMSGAGNDFVLLQDKNYSTYNLSSMAKNLCRRRLSVGADGLLAVCRLENGNIRMRYFNPDGTEAFCGNGSRCSLFWAYRQGLCGGEAILEAMPGRLKAEICGSSDNGRCGTVKMAMPDVSSAQVMDLALLNGSVAKAVSIDTGVPHCVVLLSPEKQAELDVQNEGRAIRYNKIFPQGTNSDFIAVGKDGIVKVRTYERGVEAETLACGTGITASAISAGIMIGIKSPASLRSKSGENFKIWFDLAETEKKSVFSAKNIFMHGPAEEVFKGKIDI